MAAGNQTPVLWKNKHLTVTQESGFSSYETGMDEGALDSTLGRASVTATGTRGSTGLVFV